MPSQDEGKLAGVTAGRAAEPELTVSICEETGHVGHFARIIVGYPDHWAKFCLTAETAAFLSQALAGSVQQQQPAPELSEVFRELALELDAEADNLGGGVGFVTRHEIAGRIRRRLAAQSQPAPGTDTAAGDDNHG